MEAAGKAMNLEAVGEDIEVCMEDAYIFCANHRLLEEVT